MEFQGKTHIGVILDKSGSMGSVRKETIDGFNAWLKSMQETPGEASLTLTLFDTTFSTPVKAAPIAKVNPLDDAKYRPSGSTALLDAVGSTLAEIGDGVAEDRYIFCIVTDGQENASTRYTKEDIEAQIKIREKLGNWTFTYLSAGVDAFSDAASIGINMMNTQAYTSDAIGTQAAFMSNAGATRSFRASGASASKSFYGGQRHADARDVTGVRISPISQAAAMDLLKITNPWVSDEKVTSEWVSK